MTDRSPHAAADRASPQERHGDEVLSRALGRARWTIFWERLWPGVASIATVVGLFLAVSWLGLWLWLPPIGRAIGLGVFFLLAAAAFAPLLTLRLPSRHDGLRRLDRNSSAAASTGDRDRRRDGGPDRDSFSVALWRAHIERALRSATTLKAGVPAPRLALRDPFALRALVAVLVVATFLAAGGERIKRIVAAFDWQGVMVPANFRIDAWVSPPTYTGRPPVILQGLRPGEPVQTAANLSVPAGSTLLIRATGIRLDVVASGGAERPEIGRAFGERQGHRGAPVRHQRGRHGHRARRRFARRDLALHRHPRQAADDRAGQGPGRARRAAPCCFPTSSRTTTASSARRRSSSCRTSKAPTGSRRARSTTRPTSRWCCRRRAPRTASGRPPRI